MALPQVVTIGPIAAASANNIATSQTPTSGTVLTINGSTATNGVATLDTARRVLLTYGSEGSARTLVVTGTNISNAPISETLAVPSGAGGTVATLQDFLAVTSLLPLGGGWTAAVTVGTNGVASSPWKAMNIHFGPANISFGCVVSGTVNYTVEYTYDNPNTVGLIQGTIPTAWPHPTLTAKTSNADGTINDPIYHWRVTLNSGTGSVTITGIQGGIRL